MPRQVRYEGSQLDDVLERVRDDHGADARIVSADLTRSRGVGGFFARETYQVVVELDSEPTGTHRAVPEAPQDPPPPRFAPPVERPAADVRSTPPDFARVLTDLIDDPAPVVASLPLSDESATMTAPAHAPVASPRPALDEPVDLAREIAAHEAMAREIAAREAAAHEAIAGEPIDDRPRHRVRPVSEHLDESPVALGELVARLGQLVEPAPPLPTSGVIAVVGARSDAVEVAVGVAHTCGRAASEVMLAAPSDASVTPRTIGAVVAESARRRLQRGDTGPIIVAVSVAPGVEGTRWATEAIVALDAVHVRVAVGAWRPIERTVSLVDRVRTVAPVAALDLIEIDSAPAPEQFLGLGVAIGTVDGAPSTAMLWAATLLDCGRAATVAEDHIVLAPALSPAVVPASSPGGPMVIAPEVPVIDEVDLPAVEPVTTRGGPVPAVFPTVEVSGAARR